jgi:hypothetical protein
MALIHSVFGRNAQIAAIAERVMSTESGMGRMLNQIANASFGPFKTFNVSL